MMWLEKVVAEQVRGPSSLLGGLRIRLTRVRNGAGKQCQGPENQDQKPFSGLCRHGILYSICILSKTVLFCRRRCAVLHMA